MSSQLVLLVEDNEDNARICQAILNHAGHHVVTVADGLSGLKLIRDLHPGVVLLDIGLPKMNGWEVAAAVRQDAQLDDIPLIALTAHSEKESVERARKLGFAAFIAKPAEPRRILDMVAHFVNAAAGSEVTEAPRLASP